MALCHITGTLFIPDGSEAANRRIQFQKLATDVVTDDYAGAVVPEVITTKTDADGDVDVYLITGYYVGTVLDRRGNRSYTFQATVPDQATANIADLIAASDPVEPLPAWLQEAFAARDAAEAAALAANADADRAEAEADRAYDILNDGDMGQGNLTIGPLLTVSGLTISPVVQTITTSGYSTPGDYGGATYKRVPSEPSHGGKVQSADGAWWELLDPLDLGPIELIAHRGGMANNTPQNTLIAYVQCDAWADAYETDISMTSDGVPVLFHDLSVSSITSGTGNITDATYAATQGWTFNTLSGSPNMRSVVRIARYDAFLDYALRTGKPIYPELKNMRSNSDIDTIVNMTRAKGMLPNTIFQSFDLSQCLYVYNNHPDAKCGYLVGTLNAAALTAAIDAIKNYPNRAILLVNFQTVLDNPTIAERLRWLRIGLGVWTVNSQNVARELISLGVRHIMSDVTLTKGK